MASRFVLSNFILIKKLTAKNQTNETASLLFTFDDERIVIRSNHLDYLRVA